MSRVPNPSCEPRSQRDLAAGKYDAGRANWGGTEARAPEGGDACSGLSRRALLVLGGAGVLALGAGAVASRRASAGLRDGELRWGMTVDLDRCGAQGNCRACIDACHAAHNVPATEVAQHEIKWIWKEHYADVFPERSHSYLGQARKQLPVLVMCNHCQNPPCTRVCPTGATWQREDGVVAMDQHRCIGCRYCMTACPYGARSFNFEPPQPQIPSVSPGYPTRTLGVVEKCSFCVERLEAGLSPLCVEACQKHGAGALAFGNLAEAVSTVRRSLETREALRRKPALGTEPQIYYLL